MRLEQRSPTFRAWCDKLAREVAKKHKDLKYAQAPDYPGLFSNKSRFVVMSLMNDGRVLISGMEAVTEPIVPGAKIPRTKQLFPGSLATELTLTPESAKFAERAIGAWLTFDDNGVAAVRRDAENLPTS